MGADLTLRTGLAGDVSTIVVDWFDENSTRRQIILKVIIESFDKPRTLTVLLDNIVLAQISGERINLR